MTPTLDEWELRTLLGALARRLGPALDSSTTLDLARELGPLAAARAAELGCRPPTDLELREIAGRWLSESCVAAVVGMLEEEE